MAKRNWCFTLYADKKETKEILENASEVKYCIFQEEKTKTDKLHLQGYIEFNKPMRMAAVKKVFDDDTIHLEERKGTREQARDYCKKSESRVSEPIEIGVWGKQGTRNDIKTMVEEIKAGATDEEILDKYPGNYLRYNKAIDKIRLMKKPKIEKKQVSVYWGKSGTGKTRKVHDENKDVYPKSDNKWWDGYHGEKVVLMDDFYGGIPIGDMLKILDRYPCMVEIKGGSVWLSANKIYITSNKKPEEWYNNINEEQWEALKRRLDEVVEFS